MKGYGGKNMHISQLGSIPFRFFIFMIALVLGTGPLLASEINVAEPVSVVDKGTYYEVVMDLEHGASHWQSGQAYGRNLLKAVPNFEALLDSYLKECSINWFVYRILLHRVRQMRNQIPRQYADEIDGIASQLSGARRNRRGDGRISRDELYLFNLLGDVGRLSQCCALAVFGNRSATGSTIVGRNFDWPDGHGAQLSQLQAVVTVKDGESSFTNLTCLGFQGGVSMFNQRGIFAALLDSPTGTRYSAAKRKSIVFDLRKSVEEAQDMLDVSRVMTNPDRRYAFSHLVFLADAKRSVVLENDISKQKSACKRFVRCADSPIRGNLPWGLPDAIGCVNCFAAEGSVDNHIDPLDKKFAKGSGMPPRDINQTRWQSMREQLQACGDKVSADDMKHILAFYHPESGGKLYAGDLYNSFTIQSIVFEPATLSLQVAFRPRGGKGVQPLCFEKVTGISAQQPMKSAEKMLVPAN